MLNSYIQKTQLLLHDQIGAFYTLPNITNWINQARQRVAADSECIRILPPSSSGILSYAVTNPGSGYTAATAAITAPNLTSGVQATATVTVLAGAVTAVNVLVAGSGYTVSPLVTISGDGTGAAAAATLTAAVQTTPNQEVYPFSAFNTFVQQTPGVASILAVRQIAVYWGALKPALQYMPWTKFNALLRAYSINISNFPSVFSQYGQGQSGSVYVWPVPSQQLGMDWDCTCVPIDLTSDATVEAIPDPWTEAVPYRAAHLALLYSQRTQDAVQMDEFYKDKLRVSRANSQRTMVPSWYW